MAYADQSMSSRKLVAIIGVGLLHAALGYAFITGLAFNVIKKVSTDLKTFDVQEAPPPKEAPPPPPPQKVVQPPPVVSPPPIVQVQSVAPPTIVSVPVAPPVVIHETAPPAPPAPSVASPLKPRGDPNQWVTSDDYPSADIRANNQGTTAVRLDIDATGKATNCTVTASSGFQTLDDKTCQMLMRRARFTPAKDASGAGIPQTWSKRVRWQVPKD